ncbi:ATP-binding cassette domain-containing protein [Paracoccus marcusii]|uniref:ATP-binding cassette domain-containing protein n=1 Tax=Paracoccus marcusii TaxID=59779 RepID=UPI0039C880BA
MGPDRAGRPAGGLRQCQRRARPGISIIHQELSLAPNLSVRDNIFMGREIMGTLGVNYAEEDRQTRALMEELEEQIDPATLVEDLRLGQQQIVEIARALSVDSRILIMDEPTSALSASEVEVLFKVIRDLTARGVSIVYISHHLEEALTITDHAVVLRDGVMTAYAPRADIDLEWIVRNMVGENYDLGSPRTAPWARSPCRSATCRSRTPPARTLCAG